MVKVAALVGMLVAASGCGASASDDPVLRTNHACLPGVCPEAAAPAEAVDSGLGNAPLEGWPDTNAGSLSGVYAMEVVVTAKVVGLSVPLDLLFRLRILQTFETSQVEQSTTVCALNLPNVAHIATITVPPRLTTLIQTKSATVASGDFLPLVGASRTYAPPPFLLVLGAKFKPPENPATAPLPTEMDLTNEWDEDDDGHPGVTVDALVPIFCTNTQALYVAIRTEGTLSGTVGDTGTINGTMQVAEKLSVLGYSNTCLQAASGLNPTIPPSAPFNAIRMADETALHAKGNVTCSDILAAAPKLFGKNWNPSP